MKRISDSIVNIGGSYASEMDATIKEQIDFANECISNLQKAIKELETSAPAKVKEVMNSKEFAEIIKRAKKRASLNFHNTTPDICVANSLKNAMKQYSNIETKQARTPYGSFAPAFVLTYKGKQYVEFNPLAI
jgi:Na+/phosphate symporter